MSILAFLVYSTVYGQHKLPATDNQQVTHVKIKATIIGFLKWYKKEQADTAKKPYSITKGGYPDTTTDFRIDTAGLEIYLKQFEKTGYVSETYLNSLRLYFKRIDDELKLDSRHRQELFKVDGLDNDWVLDTFEPEIILNHIKEGRFDKISSIYNKAITRFRISNLVQLLFTLTRYKDKWLIDYIGYDATSQYSMARQ